MVLVTLMSSEEGREVAHSLQNLESEGLSVWHFGHLFDIAGFLFSHAWSEKEYQGMSIESMLKKREKYKIPVIDIYVYYKYYISWRSRL